MTQEQIAEILITKSGYAKRCRNTFIGEIAQSQCKLVDGLSRKDQELASKVLTPALDRPDYLPMIVFPTIVACYDLRKPNWSLVGFATQ